MNTPVLTLSDPQFHSFKAHSRLLDGVNSRLLDQIAAWNQAVRIGFNRGCRLLLIPGDVFEVRGSIKPSVFNRVTRLVREALDLGFDMVIVPGNHDMEHFEAGESSIDSWNYLGAGEAGGTRCHVLREPRTIRTGGFSILGIPYMHGTKRFKEAFADLSASGPEITLIHQGIDDFKTDRAAPETGLTSAWLEKHNKGIILCGHYHNPGRSSGGRVINVGALVQHRHSDEGNERGCWTFDPANGSARFHPLESPRFVTVRDAGSVGPQCRGAFVRILAKGVKEAERLKELVENAGAHSIVTHVEREFTTAHEKTVTLSTPRAMLAEYLDIVDKYRDRKHAVLAMFDRVCLEDGASAGHRASEPEGTSKETKGSPCC